MQSFNVMHINMLYLFALIMCFKLFQGVFKYLSLVFDWDELLRVCQCVLIQYFNDDYAYRYFISSQSIKCTLF